MDISKVEYPYYKNYHDLPEILNAFEDLKTYEYDYIESKKPNNIYMINVDFDRDERLLRITDYFTEDCRVICNFADFISPYEYFRLNRESIIKSVGEEPTYQEIDQRLTSKKYGGPKQCSLFNTIVCTSVLKYFKPKRWLDPSAGWGDRLISAINYGECEYRATDPNECLHPKYKEIIDTLADEKFIEDEFGKRPKYRISKEGFEEAEIEANFYDLVFTSPPFFDLEKYSNAPTQSNVKFTQFEAWMNGFMYPLLIKSVAALKKNGHLCLYVNDYRGMKYVADIQRYLKGNKRMKFLGCISWQQGSYPKNIYVYQKVKK